eukprot:Opistho-1_new@60105
MALEPEALGVGRPREQQALHQWRHRRDRGVDQQHVALAVLIQPPQPVQRHQRGHGLFQLQGVDPQHLGHRLQAQALGRGVARGVQLLQRLQRQLEAPARRIGAPRNAREQAGQVGRDDRTQQHDHPGHVEPHQQDGHGGKGAVDHGIRGHLREVPGQHLLRQLQPRSHEHATQQRMAPAHPGVGHVAVQRGNAPGEQRELHRPEQETHAARQAGHHVPRHRDGEGGHRQAAGQQQRPEREHRPVHQHALRERARLAHAPDVVELAVDGEDERQRRDEQHQRAGPAHLPGLVGKLVEVAEHLLGDVGRHQALHPHVLCVDT